MKQFDWNKIARENLQLHADTDQVLHAALMRVLWRLREGQIVGGPAQRRRGVAYVVIVSVPGRNAEYMIVWAENGPDRRFITHCGPRLAS